MVLVTATYLAVGSVAGVLAGLLGVGGGLVIVPALAWVFQESGFPSSAVMHMAVGTSLATIVATAASSVRAHHARGAVRWALAARLAPGVMAGALAGAALAAGLSTRWMTGLFGLLEVLIGGYMLAKRERGPAEAGGPMPGTLAVALAGAVIGTVSGVAGIAGGTLTVPLLVRWRVPVAQAIATSAAVGLPIAISGGLGFVATGWDVALPRGSLGYVYLPAVLGIALASVSFAPLGARLAHRLPTGVLRRVFAVFLLLVGTRLLLSAISSA